MQTECDAPRVAARRAPVGASGHLRDALTALGEGCGTVTRQSERPWASITFEGARHAFEIVFEGCEAVSAGERFVVALPEHEFVLRGQIVAEAAITGVDHTLLPEPRMTVTCELLLLKDA